MVVIVPKAEDGRWLLIEQRREPEASNCIEFPAGLAGDSDQFAGEPLVEAARRELLERRVTRLSTGNTWGAVRPAQA